MALFRFKQEDIGNIPVTQYLNPEKLSNTDKKISSKIQQFEYDYEEVNKSRIAASKDIAKLKRAMEQVKKTDLSILWKNKAELEKASMKDVRQFEQCIRKQLKDIQQIILQLKKLIENEYLELMYDVRTPLVTFELFTEQLKKLTLDMELRTNIGAKIERIFKQIEFSYDALLDYTFKFIDNDFKYYNSIGLDFHKFDNNLETELALVTHLKNRTKLKQQINGKTQWIKKQIARLDEIFKALSKKGVLKKIHADEIIKNLNYFAKQFEGLVEFCTQRVDVANHTVIESIVMQISQHEELEALKKELRNFYALFMQLQEEMKKSTDSRWKTDQIEKRMKQFQGYKEEIEGEFADFEKIFELKIDKIEQDDVQKLAMESKEARRAMSYIPKFKKGFRRSVIILMAGLSLLGVANQSSRAIQSSGKISAPSAVVQESQTLSRAIIGGRTYRLDTGSIYVVTEEPQSALSRFIVQHIDEESPKLNKMLSSIGHLGILFFDHNRNSWMVSEQVNFTRTISLTQSHFDTTGSFVFQVKGVDAARVRELSKEFETSGNEFNYKIVGRTCQSHVFDILNKAGLDLKGFDLLGVDKDLTREESEGLYRYFNVQTHNQLETKIQSALNWLKEREIPFIDAKLDRFIKTDDEKVFFQFVNSLRALFNANVTIYNMFFSHILPFQDFMMKNFGTSNAFVVAGLRQNNLEVIKPAQ